MGGPCIEIESDAIFFSFLFFSFFFWVISYGSVLFLDWLGTSCDPLAESVPRSVSNK